MHVRILGITFTLMAMLPSNAHASTMAAIICWVIHNILWGDLGRAVATIGVAVLAASAALGRASWTAAVTVAIGISIIFGAPAIVAGFGLTPC